MLNWDGKGSRGRRCLIKATVLGGGCRWLKTRLTLSEEKNIFTIEWSKGKRVKIDKSIAIYILYTVYTHTSTSFS